MYSLNKDFLAMTELDIMALYAKTHLKQDDAGIAEFVEATTAFYVRIGRYLASWRRELKLDKYPVKARLENWSFDSCVIQQDFTYCLSRNIKYGNGGATTRIIGYDLENRRVLTQTGSIYELA